MFPEVTASGVLPLVQYFLPGPLPVPFSAASASPYHAAFSAGPHPGHPYVTNPQMLIPLVQSLSYWHLYLTDTTVWKAYAPWDMLSF